MKYAVELLNITKRFPGILANDDITLKIEKGKIHALLGENGAGKSTLMSILFGLYSLDEGTIKINETEVKITNPNDANALGIGMVHQHFKLVQNFTVLENIVLGVETTKHNMLDMTSARKKVMDLSMRYGLAVNPDRLISEITVGMQQRVEILKMLYRDNDILIFDEPTSVLLPQEVDELIKIIHGLAAEGKTILFISHKLDEIKRVAEKCTVLRRGKVIGTVEVALTTKEQMAEMMVGRKVLLNVDKGEGYKGEEKKILEVRDLSVKDKISGKLKVNHVSFSIKAGEIVCIAGVDGNGQTQLVEAITGLLPSTGEIYLCGKDVTKKNIRYRNTNGLAHIPEDRQRHGLVMEFTISENAILQEYFDRRFQNKGFIKKVAVDNYADTLIKKYDVRAGMGRETSAGSLSGGNQQKLILARELERNHELVIAVQPTRGLDVGAIEQVQQQIVLQRNAGKAVLLVSLELEEVMSLSDRILVIHDGKIMVSDLIPSEIDMKELGMYMAGSKGGDTDVKN
ncbi:MAG: ABC transporter ATP-binding protein [Anaerolineaceae bacterium]